MNSIPVHLFVEGIVSAGAILVSHEHIEDYHIEWYRGPKGRCVIFICEEEILEIDAAVNLDRLGMPELMPFFFPE
jgi:hypothetical protein